MPTSTSGGPAINTGNAAWDQGLGSIFGAMSEGPAKIAQAGYYGAEQRYKQLQSSQLQEQIAAGHQFLGMTTGQMPGKPQYRTDPATGQNILADTAAVWGGSGGPASAPPAAPPGGPAPISSAVVGPPPGPAPGPVPAPAPASGFQGGGEGGGAAPIANLIADSVSKASTSNSGPPLPPASPPAPGLPPAPNTTATDGSTPADNGAGILHPGSFTPAGGGVKASGPAAPDGSPAPTAVNLGQLVALGVMKGMPAADAMGVARTVVAGWVKNGQMDQQHADDMLADLGETAMRVANLNNAGALQRTNVEQAGATTRQGMVTGETAREFNEAIIQTVNPADPNGPPIPVKRKDLQPGMQEWSQPLASQNVVTGENRRQFNEAIVQVVNPADPNGPPIAMKRSDMKPGMREWNQGVATQRGGPVVVNKPGVGPVNTTLSEAVTPGSNQPTSYQPGTADISQTQRGAFGTFMKPDDPATPIYTTSDDAQARGLVPYGTMTPKEPVDPNKSFQTNALAHNVDQELYPRAQKGSLTSPGYVEAPVVFSPAMQAKIQALEARFIRNPASRGDPGVAHRMAVQALQQSGDLPSATQVEALRNAGGVISTAGGRTTDPRLQVTPNFDGKGTSVPHLWIGGKGETNPNDPGAPTAFNLEPGPRAGSNVTPQPQPGPQAPPGPQPGPQAPPTVAVPGAPGSVTALFGQQRLPNPAYTPPPAPNPGVQTAPGRPTAGKSAPAPRTAVQATPPSGAVAEAPGKPDGTRMLIPGTNQPGVVRGGFLFPLPSVTAGGGG